MRKIKKAGKKAIIHIHGASYLAFYDGLGSVGKRIVEGFFHQADLVLALSESWRRELENRFRIDTCRTLNNGVDLSEYKTAVIDVTKYRNSFLMLGRLGERKGVYDLINAVEIARRQNPGLHVILAGNGEIEKVRRLVAQKELVCLSGNTELLKKMSENNRGRAKKEFSIQYIHKRLAVYYRQVAE